MTDHSNSIKKESSTDWPLVFILGGLFIGSLIIIWVAVSKYTNQFSGSCSSDQNIWGVFGDYMGGTLNPIFAFLSFSALLLTIYIQSRELVETRKEIKQSREIAFQQKENYQRQADKNDIYKVIELIDQEITEVFNSNSNIEGFADIPLYMFLGPFAHVDMGRRVPARQEENNNQAIVRLAKTYKRLHHYMLVLDEKISNKVVSDYYKHKYYFSVGTLHIAGYLEQGVRDYFYTVLEQ
jgi:uncharacterized membrane protein